MVAQSCEYSGNYWTVYFKWVNFIYRELYLHKTVKKINKKIKESLVCYFTHSIQLSTDSVYSILAPQYVLNPLLSNCSATNCFAITLVLATSSILLVHYIITLHNNIKFVFLYPLLPYVLSTARVTILNTTFTGHFQA